MSGNRYLVQPPSPQPSGKQAISTRTCPAPQSLIIFTFHKNPSMWTCALWMSTFSLKFLWHPLSLFHSIAFPYFSEDTMDRLFSFSLSLFPLSVFSVCFDLCHITGSVRCPWLSAYIRSEELKCFREALSTAGKGSQPQCCYCFRNKKTRKSRWSSPYKSAFQNI